MQKMNDKEIKKELPLIGWREWISLPDLNIASIKAKIDTGAHTSALHAKNIKYEKSEGKTYIIFKTYPLQKSLKNPVRVKALLVGKKKIKSSNGQSETRPVIKTKITLGEFSWLIHITLTKRDQMGFRFILGREALKDRFFVDTGRSFIID